MNYISIIEASKKKEHEMSRYSKGIIAIIFIFAFIAISSCSKNDQKEAPVAKNGVLDLTQWDPEKDGPVKLDGQWEFYWKKLLTQSDFSNNQDLGKGHLITIPGLWTDLKSENGDDNTDKNKIKDISGTGYGTYRLQMLLKKKDILYGFKILDAATSYNLLINGRKIASNGIVSSDEKEAVSQFLPQIMAVNYSDLCSQAKDETITINVIMQVSNYTHQKAGIWESIYFGKFEHIKDMRENAIIGSFFIIGIIFIMSFYHFGLYFLRRKDLSPFFFGLLSALIAIRCMVTGERILVHWFPNINFQLLNKLDYISAYCNIALIAVFIFILFKDEISKKLTGVLAGIGALYAVIIIATPLSIYSLVKPFLFDLYVLIGGLAIVSILFWLSIKKVNGALIACIGFFVMYGTGINDVLYNMQIINTTHMVSFGLSFYIISQSYLLSKLFSNAFIIIEGLSEELAGLNVSYSRFVPHQFLSFLGHNSIVHVKQGDHVQKEMTVFFSDIRSFTTLSESMTPDDNFKFLNSYLSRVSPLIRDMNGFIDKFIGDAIMALFPETADSALQASISIRNEVDSYNKFRAKAGYVPIDIGIALHTGILMLGTIGEENRMDSTVISDAVNLASRIEGLTKVFGSSIIISEETLSKLKNPDKYKFRYLGNVHVKGKNKSVKIFDVFDGDSKDIIHKKMKTLKEYETAIKHYFQKDFDEAHKRFKSVLKTNPEDMASLFYLKRAEKNMSKTNGKKSVLSEPGDDTYIRIDLDDEE
ncbi:MAG: adenylate/guanylate cyclase domain-containing protein [bacterium]|nr:adenylate/guanylate cyclase domain-containing protein [bacterium]